MEGEGEMFKNAHPAMRAMFMWHGVEEVEHKTVAFDVYETAAGGGYFTRASALIIGTLLVHAVVGSVLWHMLKIDKLQGQPLVLAKGFYRLYGPRGLITRLIPRYLDWFKPGFHPSDTEIPEKVNSWLAEYDKHQDPMEASRIVFNVPIAKAV
jgi:predicted metal-dependent hydrolase